MTQLKYYFLSICILCSYSLKAQNSNPDLDKYLLKKMERSGRIGMQAAFVSNGELEWAGSYGIKTFNTGDLVDNGTLFMTASISKPVTALGMMKLVDQGLNLDDNISSYLPFKVANPNHPGVEITFRMLLSHVSSIRDNWTMLEPGYTIDNGGDSPIALGDFLKAYLEEGGEYFDKERNYYKSAPATQEAYSNVGFALVGYLVEVISGRPFNEFMNTEVFHPLGMLNTYWFLSEIPHENIATPHNMPYKETDFKGTQVLTHFGYPQYPAGQLRTTVSDYAQILKLMINEGEVNGKPFVKKETIAEFLKVQYPDVGKWRAISWSYNEFESPIYYMLMPRYPSHTGLDPGMATVVSFDPVSKTGALIFTNSPTTTLKTEKILYLDMMKKLFKEARKSGKAK